jgi:hypothetical protein
MLDHVTEEWQYNNLLQSNILITILSADDQEIMTAQEDVPSQAQHQLCKTASYNLLPQPKQRH